MLTHNIPPYRVKSYLPKNFVPLPLKLPLADKQMEPMDLTRAITSNTTTSSSISSSTFTSTTDRPNKEAPRTDDSQDRDTPTFDGPDQSLRRGPIEQIVTYEKENITLACEINNVRNTAYWQKIGEPENKEVWHQYFGSSSSKDDTLLSKEHVAFLGNIKEGDFTIQLVDVEQAHSGTYVCSVPAFEFMVRKYNEIKAYSKVTVLPGPRPKSEGEPPESSGAELEPGNKLSFAHLPRDKQPNSAAGGNKPHTRDTASHSMIASSPSAFIPSTIAGTASNNNQIPHQLASSADGVARPANGSGLLGNFHAAALSWPVGLVVIALALVMVNIYLVVSLIKRHRRRSKVGRLPPPPPPSSSGTATSSMSTGSSSSSSGSSSSSSANQFVKKSPASIESGGACCDSVDAETQSSPSAAKRHLLSTSGIVAATTAALTLPQELYCSPGSMMSSAGMDICGTRTMGALNEAFSDGVPDTNSSSAGTQISHVNLSCASGGQMAAHAGHYATLHPVHWIHSASGQCIATDPSGQEHLVVGQGPAEFVTLDGWALEI